MPRLEHFPRTVVSYSSLFLSVCNIPIRGFDSDNTHYCCLLIHTQKAKQIILYKPECHRLVRAALGNSSDTGEKNPANVHWT